jgi:mannose-6-phosphate isomerase-like protein (cupin superfamily)
MMDSHVYERGAVMPTLLDAPVTFAAAGTPPKTIIEYVGRASTGAQEVSIAWMRSPAGWSEPAQTPAFDEYTVVLSGSITVDHDGGTTEVQAGEAIAVAAGERVRYSTPGPAEYLAICLPAFSAEIVRREDEQR